MTKAEKKVRKIIANQVGVDYQNDGVNLNLEDSMVDDLGMDSLDTIETVMLIEDEFDIGIPDEDAEKWVTVGDAVEYVAANT